jgi:thiamine-phosphate pyrophosphorylase
MAATHSTNARIPKLWLVTDRHATVGRDLVATVTRALDAGLPAVQLRDKDLSGRAIFALAERLRAATARTGALFVVNGRADVARAVGADGVQLGSTTLPVDAVRAVAPGLIVGESVHDVETAAASRADFVVFGPVHDTPSKRSFGPSQGEARLRDAAARTPAPLLAIGGMDATNAATALRAGAYGVAVIRAILAASDPAAATRELLRCIDAPQLAG